MCVKTRAFETKATLGGMSCNLYCVLQHCRIKILVGSKVNDFPASSRHAAESLLNQEKIKSNTWNGRPERYFSKVQKRIEVN